MVVRFRTGRATWMAAYALLVCCLASGCGSNRSPYPEPKVKTALGTSSTCAFCRKPIATVTEENMLTVRGVAYTVCNAKCGKYLEQWAQSQ
jgi:hypothetical protein